MALANQFKQPIDYYGTYRTNTWAGYVFKELLGYTTGVHTGSDYNGPGGGNADLGMEIRSIANGIVRYVGNKNSIGLGNTTIIEYPLSPTLKAQLGCDSLFGRYMHQNTIEVSVGQEVSIGQRIGTVGNSATQWAHLHLDLYKSTISYGGVHFNYDKDTQLASYVDPFEYIQAHLTAVDITASLLGYQRLVSNADGVNGREQASTDSKVIKEYKKGEVLDFKGYVKGQDPYGAGNNIWFVGKYSNTYWYSGAFTDKGTHDLADLTPQPTTPPPTPTNPEPEKVYSFEKDFDFITEVVPAAIDNFEYSNFPTAPTKAVIHDFGTDGKDTYESTVNEFKKKGTEKSSQFVVSGLKRAQMVKLGDRAYHAGPTGNVYVGIETDPKQDNDTIISTRLILQALRAKYGYKLEVIKHSSLMNTQCGDDVNLEHYDIDKPFPVVVTPTPEQPSDIDKENNVILKQILAIVQWIKDKWPFK